MFRFPYTNLHELNLDWILSIVKHFANLIPNMEAADEHVQQALDDSATALETANEAAETAEEAKEIAEQAAGGAVPSDTPPLMDGTASAGVALPYSRGDHVHPTDTSRASQSDMTSAQDNITALQTGKAATDASNISSASDWLTALGTKASDFTIYDSVTDLEITSGSATITGVLSAMPERSILYASASEFAVSERPTRAGAGGYILIVKADQRISIEFKGQGESNQDYRMFVDSNNLPTGNWTNNGVTAYYKKSASSTIDTFTFNGNNSRYSVLTIDTTNDRNAIFNMWTTTQGNANGIKLCGGDGLTLSNSGNTFSITHESAIVVYMVTSYAGDLPTLS